jgi:uroporphyrinogen decarboxylase
MNKRQILLDLIDHGGAPGYTPAAFFLHFDPIYHQGQAAIDKHLEFFHATGMDFVKIQYEQRLPPAEPFRRPSDWTKTPRLSEAFYEPTIHLVEGLVKAAGKDALVILTLYSPFMLAGQLARQADLDGQMREDPLAVGKGLEILAENVRTLVRACRRVGVDGFYASTQGGEAFRFAGTDIFEKIIKPSDLAVWDAIDGCPFSILHICDYVSGYDDLRPFLDYPGQVVNCSLKLGAQELTPLELPQFFGRPFMGGLERKGLLATGSPEQTRLAARSVLDRAPRRFILAADCTVPSETPWENLKAAVDEAHQFAG